MGFVQNRRPMQSRNTPTDPKDILRFDISDGSAIVKVTVWPDLANSLNQELDRMIDQDNIIILTSCGITKYRNQLQASTLSPSKFYINPDYDAVHHLRTRLNTMTEPIVPDNKSPAADYGVKKTPVYNLKQITNLRSSELKEMEVICYVSVCNVEEQSKWWFYSCDSCPLELSIVDNAYKCECGKIVSYPDKRFKVPVYVTDPSETIQVFLFDREVRRLISTNVNSLIGQNRKEEKGNQFPEKLKTITGKNLTITISLNEKNLIHGNTVYFASDVVEGVQTSEDSTLTQNSGINSKMFIQSWSEIKSKQQPQYAWQQHATISKSSKYRISNHAESAAAEASDPSLYPKRSSEWIIGDDSEKDQQVQQILSPCIGRKRTIRRNTLSLPEDILYNEILPRLPTVFILRFRLVCKSWNSYFSISGFINSHVTHLIHHEQKDDPDFIIIKCFAMDEGISILSHTNEFPIRSVPCVCDTILGSINGLVLMCSTRGKRFCLWNPVMGQAKFFRMPPPRFHPTKDQCKHFVGGFCWDRVQNDYKVLMFCFDSTTSSSPSQLCIYSFNSATWTRLPVPHLPMLRGPKGNPNLMVHPATIVKGTPYWSYSESRTIPGKRRSRKFFCTFKLVPEINEFRSLPDFNTTHLMDGHNFLVNIKDRFVGILTYEVRSEETLVKIYSLEEESESRVWSMMYSIGPISLGSSCRPSHCFKNGGELLIHKHRGPFSLYDPRTKETKEFNECISSANAIRIRMYYSYTPSLICVRGMKPMQNLSKKNGSNSYRFVKSDLPSFVAD